MTPNVSRLLIKWGVADKIGKNLVEFEELNMRRRDGTRVGYTRMMPDIREQLGQPWWVVHRMHLHEGLVEIARQEGAKLVIDARVAKVEYETGRPKVITEKGDVYEADLIIGSDGVNSIVRRTLFPEVVPKGPTTNCAYRAIVPYSQIRKDPIAKELVEKLTMEVWMSDNSYIITYPISDGELFNLVLSHHEPKPMDQWEADVMPALRETYKDYDPRYVSSGMIWINRRDTDKGM
jgi:salicylate hydroxylase